MVLGPGEALIVLEIAFAPELDVDAVTAAVRRLERAVIDAAHGATRRSLVVIEPTASTKERREAA